MFAKKTAVLPRSVRFDHRPRRPDLKRHDPTLQNLCHPKNVCHPEQREGPMQFAGADRVHRSFALLRMTTLASNFLRLNLGSRYVGRLVVRGFGTSLDLSHGV